MILYTKHQRAKDKRRFGGNTLAVYERDGYKCVRCRMTMDAHLLKYGRRLTIDHIDGSGRKKVHKFGAPESHKVINNNMDNLQTLCLPCHGIKDGGRTIANQHGTFTEP